jgi:Innexin
MYKLLGGLKDYFKLQEIQTDNAVFRLHNVFTTVLLLTCSLVITATQYVGQPISCIVNGIPTHVVNTFCWISSTFTMPDAFRREVRSTFRFASCISIFLIKTWRWRTDMHFTHRRDCIPMGIYLGFNYSFPFSPITSRNLLQHVLFMFYS